MADDLGYSVDLVLRADYAVTRKTDQKLVYKPTKEIKLNAENSPVPLDR